MSKSDYNNGFNTGNSNPSAQALEPHHTGSSQTAQDYNSGLRDGQKKASGN